MATQSADFGAAVKAWCERSEAKLLAVFQTSFENTVEAVKLNTPIDTAFLVNSLTVTIGEPATIDPTASGKKGSKYRAPETAAVIASAKLGDTLSAGFVAVYARRIEYGFVGTDSLGREYNQQGRAMVRLAIQRFPEFVQAAIAEANRRT